MAIDVSAHFGFSQQRHVVLARQKAHVIDLRDARHKELNGAPNQVGGLIATHGIKERAVDLVQIQIGRGCTCGLTALPL